ncbi:hypothetical protein [Aureispira sp. CCB-E]|uniref:hypothetical protein n=1 Tax=Aureispira sp. CCB-E TaxID=3051121 RepID=UPI0028686A5B|nr:hypothetical protein [Aureispira sp. CCB-E]WMX15295.1 hypothetical protein QP953_02780 [Aureispira sp. CCB-E]
MRQPKVRIQKGAKVSYKGAEYKVSKPIILVPIDGADSKETPVQAEQKTDHPQPIDKNTVLNLIERKIKALEEEEYNALFDIEEDDPLFLFDRSENFEKTSFSEQMGRVQAIQHLKAFLAKIKRL